MAGGLRYILNANGGTTVGASGPFTISGGPVQGAAYFNANSSYTVGFDASRVVPTAPVNRPRAWGALACVYLGAPR